MHVVIVKCLVIILMGLHKVFGCSLHFDCSVIWRSLLFPFFSFMPSALHFYVNEWPDYLHMNKKNCVLHLRNQVFTIQGSSGKILVPNFNTKHCPYASLIIKDDKSLQYGRLVYLFYLSDGRIADIAIKVIIYILVAFTAITYLSSLVYCFRTLGKVCKAHCT